MTLPRHVVVHGESRRPGLVIGAARVATDIVITLYIEELHFSTLCECICLLCVEALILAGPNLGLRRFPSEHTHTIMTTGQL